MTCTEALELLPAAIDGQIGKELLSQLNLHLGECSHCLHEFELEQMTKNVIRKYSSSTPPPDHLRARILHHVRRERSLSATPAKGAVLRPPFPKTGMFTLGAVGAILLLLLFVSPMKSHRHSHAQPADADVVHLTYNNYDAVLSGNISPEILSNDHQKINAFFTPMADFKVQIPSMRDFKLIGALSSKYNGKCIAQLVYRRAEEIVYLFEVKLGTALRSENGFRISPEAISQLQRTGWYVENHLPDCSLAMWVVDSTLCCAVADINKDVLLASLTEYR